MRIGIAALGFAAACGFHGGGGAANGSDGGPGLEPIGGDAPVDTPPIDSAPVDTSPIDAPPVDTASPARRIAITIPTVAATQSDFPVWLDIDQADLVPATPNGADLYFTDANGSLLAFQIQSYDGAHHVQAWAKVPTLANNTTLYLCFGDPAVTHAQDPAGTFSNNFAAVWHLDDALANGDPIGDATGTHQATDVGLDATHSVAAPLGKGVEFEGADSTMITFTNPLSGAQSHTISLWITATGSPSQTDDDAMIILGDITGQHDQSRWFHARYGTNQDVALGFYGDDWTTTGAHIEPAAMANPTPHLLHWVFTGNNTKSELFVDGLSVGTHNHTNGVNTQGTSGFIGWAPLSFGGNMGLHGIVDEVRISTQPRGASWIAVEYANQSAPGTFYQLSAAQPF